MRTATINSLLWLSHVADALSLNWGWLDRAFDYVARLVAPKQPAKVSDPAASLRKLGLYVPPTCMGIPGVDMPLYRPGSPGLHDPLDILHNEKSACGVGGVVSRDGKASRKTMERLERIIACMPHRGGCTFAKGESDPLKANGDGAGVKVTIPLDFFRPALEQQVPGFQDSDVKKDRDLGIGMFFLPHHAKAQTQLKRLVEQCVKKQIGQETKFVWRHVPVDTQFVGERAERKRPDIWQLLVVRPQHIKRKDFSAKLVRCRFAIQYAVNNLIERDHSLARHLATFYVCSFNADTVVYKGMLTGPQLFRFYKDLGQETFAIKRGIGHERFSTNTESDWFNAQPFEFLCHNGEFNTLLANKRFIKALEALLDEKLDDPNLRKWLRPMINPRLSDSGAKNDVLTVLHYFFGMSVPEVMAAAMPYAWETDRSLSEQERAFWKYWAAIMPAWNGPAAVFFDCDNHMGARLNSNGFRPLRWMETEDMIVFASESNILGLHDAERLRRDRLGPGQMLLIDTHRSDDGKLRLQNNTSVMEELVNQRDYPNLVRAVVREPGNLNETADENPSGVVEGFGQTSDWPLIARAIAAGWTEGEVVKFLIPACGGVVPFGSMGDDTQIAVLRDRQMPATIFHFWQELFAQVTNPPVDYLREGLVVSLRTLIGKLLSPLDEEEELFPLLTLKSPVLTRKLSAWVVQNAASASVAEMQTEDDAVGVISTTYSKGNRKQRLDAMVGELDALVAQGKTAIVLSDRAMDGENRFVPAALAVSHLDNHLTKTGRRGDVSMIVETAEPKCAHDLACLYGFGASAVLPYVAFGLIERICRLEGERVGNRSLEECLTGYLKSVNEELMKIMCRMGVHTFASYRGGRIFDPIGLNGEFCERYFGVDKDRSPIEGYGLNDVERTYDTFHQLAVVALASGREEDDILLPEHGRYHQDKRGLPRNFSMSVVNALQKAARAVGFKPELWRRFRHTTDENVHVGLRHFLGIKLPEDVQVSDETKRSLQKLPGVWQRFRTSPISLGAISPEAHETMALAAYVLDMISGSGEGGEDAARLKVPQLRSRLKQVASGRFGVNMEYLLSATEIEIKMAQGAKAGEGGALKFNKVTAEVALNRGTKVAVPLTSPPPHHDIYSIEDLAQLIFDLKMINPKAKIIVKLVAASTIGTIAVGVAKAGADVIQICGWDGGTGNAPEGSKTFTGWPWEIGVALAHQALVQAGIRDEVLLGVDGGFRSGADVIKAALLGADLFGFGTAAMIAGGCAMNRRCHLNDCPVGWATMDPKFRARFDGKAEYVVNYFYSVGLEVKWYLDLFGVESIGELVGRTDLLEVLQSALDEAEIPISFRKVLYRPEPEWVSKVANEPREHRNTLRPVKSRLDEELMSRAEGLIESGKGHLTVARDQAYSISTQDLSVGAGISRLITQKWGRKGLPEGCKIDIALQGTGGQSFGLGLAGGVTLRAYGGGNDYIGKMMHEGSTIVLRSQDERHGVLFGNALAMGANGGRLYVSGSGGERSFVLNKKAEGVVEGAGWHFCEYMCGGTAVSLFPVGRNAFSGMTGGLAFVLADEDGGDSFLKHRCNLGNVEVRRLNPDTDGEHIAHLKELIEKHAEETYSKRARKLLADWDSWVVKFYIAIPKLLSEEQRECREAYQGQYDEMAPKFGDVDEFMTPTRREWVDGAEKMRAQIVKRIDEGLPEGGNPLEYPEHTTVSTAA